MEKSKKMKLGSHIVFHKAIKQNSLSLSIVPLLTSKIGQNLKENVFKSYITYFLRNSCGILSKYM